ncbi:MAG: biotin/lipoyl-binding protein, partial [Alistipes sp.]|nr:biotin/lipoyl-binding protein [Alistipes sp.]
CAMDEKAGREMYTNKSSQFIGLVKGDYGHTPVKIDPEFRFKICGFREEIPYDTSKYQMQPNPELPEAGGVKLAATEKEVLLLELFPLVAKNFLTNTKKSAYEAEQAAAAAKAAEEARIAAEQAKEAAKKAEVEAAFKAATAPAPIIGNTVNAPLPGRVLEIKVKVGDDVKRGETVVILEAMKMENNITSDYSGKVRQILVGVGEAVGDNTPMVEIE